jgi:hypothetical protein
MKYKVTNVAKPKPIQGGYLIPINVCAGDTASTLTSRMWKDGVTNYMALSHYPSTAVLIEYEL